MGKEGSEQLIRNSIETKAGKKDKQERKKERKKERK